MMATIIAEGQLEKKQYAKLCIEIYYRKPAVIFFTIIGIAVVIYVFSMMEFYASIHKGILIAAFLYAAYIVARPYLIYLNASNYFTTSKNLQEKVHYEFSEEKIITQGETFKGEKGWDNFYKIVELKHFFLMYHDARLMNIIPKVFFQHEGDVKALRELIHVKSHLKQKLREH